MSDDLFAPGATVYRENGKVEKVAKRYKNGNIVLEGFTQQYRTYGDSASSTGGDGWSRSHLFADTPENRGRAARSRRLALSTKAIRDEIDRLNAALRSRDNDKIIEEGERILSQGKEGE